MTKHRGEHFDPELLDVFFASLNDIKQIHAQYADQLPRGMIVPGPENPHGSPAIPPPVL
jgi:HD-GYP domain-containing protein (c-di-GMP phosphodiesterase class II)